MNIIISSLYFYPEQTGIGVYSYDFARYLAEKGHNIKVLASFPFYPEWKKFKDYPSKLFYKETISGIEVLRCYTYVPELPGTLKRIIHELIYCISVFLRSLFLKKSDLLICITPPFFSMVTMAVISRLRNIPLHIHIQDLQPDAAIELGMIKNKFAIRILRRLERFSYNTAELISSIGVDMNNNLLKKGISEDKLILFRNWVNFREISENSAGFLQFRKKHGLSDDFIVLHSGNIGEKQGLCTLLEAALLAQNKKEPIKFLIAGGGARKQVFLNRVKALHLENVRFLGVQPKEEFYKMLLSADISLVLLRKEVKEIAIPSKLLNILAVGCPLIASVNPESETAKILKDLPVNVVVPPEDPAVLFNRIMQYKSRKPDLELLRCSEKKMATCMFDRNLILSDILSQLETRFGDKTILS